jgi:hypothetical protein
MWFSEPVEGHKEPSAGAFRVALSDLTAAARLALEMNRKGWLSEAEAARITCGRMVGDWNTLSPSLQARFAVRARRILTNLSVAMPYYWEARAWGKQYLWAWGLAGREIPPAARWQERERALLHRGGAYKLNGVMGPEVRDELECGVDDGEALRGPAGGGDAEDSPALPCDGTAGGGQGQDVEGLACL